MCYLCLAFIGQNKPVNAPAQLNDAVMSLATIR